MSQTTHILRASKAYPQDGFRRRLARVDLAVYLPFRAAHVSVADGQVRDFFSLQGRRVIGEADLQLFPWAVKSRYVVVYESSPYESLRVVAVCLGDYWHSSFA